MKRFILSVLLSGVVLISHSQELKSPQPAAFQPGWYLGANGGINIYIAEGNNFLDRDKQHYISLKDNMGSLTRLSLGYDFTPVFGIRGMLGSSFHYWPDVRFPKVGGGFKDVAFGAENVTADLMLNLSQWVFGYKPDRLMNVSIFAGTGIAHRDRADFPSDFTTPIGRGGGELDFRLSRLFDLNVIGEMNAVGDNYNGYVATLPVDLYGGLTVGFTYHFGREPKMMMMTSGIAPTEQLQTKELAKAEPVQPVVEPTTQPAAVAAVEPLQPAKQESAQTVQPEKQEKAVQPTQPVKQETAPARATEVKTETPSPVMEPAHNAQLSAELWVNVFYPLNQRNIVRARQKAAISKVVDYLMLHPEAKIIVRGFADRGTGSAAQNRVVSKIRANNVTELLKSKYAISSERIQTISYGSRVQLYKQKDLNRLTTVSSVNAEPFKNGTVFKQETKPVEEASTVTKTDEKNNSDLRAEVLFKGSKNAIETADQAAMLMKVALYMRRNPEAKVLVSGYADKSTGSQSNEISKKRAVNVTNALILKYSIDQSRIQTKWFGSAKKHNSTASKNQLVMISSIPNNKL